VALTEIDAEEESGESSLVGTSHRVSHDVHLGALRVYAMNLSRGVCRVYSIYLFKHQR